MDSPNLKEVLHNIDSKIADLLAERLKAVKEKGASDEVSRDLVEDTEYEAEVIASFKALAYKKGVDAGDAETVYRKILAISKNLYLTEVAFQGEDGSHGQEVAYNFFGRSVRTRQCDTIEGVFDLVQEGNLAYGIVPVENSQDGSIGHSYDLLLESDVRVCGETQARTSYCLLAHRSAGLGSIKKIYSHPQALAQCQAFLRHLGYELIPTYTTTSMAKMIKEKKLVDSAVVAGEGVASIYDMKVIAREIEDNPRNSTRFFIISKRDSLPTGNDKTSIVILLKHEPGTLHKAIQQFAERNINLTKVESRPTRKTPWEYHFYLDFEGHRQDKVIGEALQNLEKACLFLKVLGSYPKAPTL